MCAFFWGLLMDHEIEGVFDEAWVFFFLRKETLFMVNLEGFLNGENESGGGG